MLETLNPRFSAQSSFRPSSSSTSSSSSSNLPGQVEDEHEGEGREGFLWYEALPLENSASIFLESKPPPARISLKDFMKTRHFLIALSLLALVSTGCDWRGIRGNGNVKIETRQIGSFTRIAAGGFYEIDWKPGPPSLSITTDENLLSYVETSVDGGTLKIQTHDQVYTRNGIKIVVTSPSLAGADLSGALKLEATQLQGDRFSLETSGASKVNLSGTTSRLLASLTGASRLNAESLQAQDVEIAVTGAGQADIFASHSVKAAITGAGKVNYAGHPKEVQKKVTGAGKISPRD